MWTDRADVGPGKTIDPVYPPGGASGIDAPPVGAVRVCVTIIPWG